MPHAQRQRPLATMYQNRPLAKTKTKCSQCGTQQATPLPKARYLARSYLTTHSICGFIRIFQIKPLIRTQMKTHKVQIVTKCSRHLIILISLSCNCSSLLALLSRVSTAQSLYTVYIWRKVILPCTDPHRFTVRGYFEIHATLLTVFRICLVSKHYI